MQVLKKLTQVLYKSNAGTQNVKQVLKKLTQVVKKLTQVLKKLTQVVYKTE